MNKKEKREGYNPPPKELNPPERPTPPSPGSYITVVKINGDIKSVEKLLLGVDISCTVIEGKLSLEGI